MIKNPKQIRFIWLITGILSLMSSFSGILKPVIYEEVVSAKIMAGVMSQDITVAAASILLIISSLTFRKENFVKFTMILGILGFIFYAYGIYVIEQLYTVLYFVYMVIFGLSFYSIIFTLIDFNKEYLKQIKVPKWLKNMSIIFLLINPVIFIPLWSMQILKFIEEANRVEYTFSIHILDNCFIMPAFIIVAVLAIRNNGWGLLLTPALFVNVIVLLGSVALGAFLKPNFNQPMDVGGIMLYLIISLLFLILVIAYYSKIRILDNTNRL